MDEFPVSPEVKTRIQRLAERLTESGHKAGLDDCEILIAAMCLTGRFVAMVSDGMFESGDLSRLERSEEVAKWIGQINAMFTDIDIEERKNG